MEKTKSIVTFCDWDWYGKQRVFCRKSDPDVLPKKAALKYLAKLTGKHVCWGFFQKKYQTVGLQLYLKRDSCKGFFSVPFLKVQNSFFNRCFSIEGLRKNLKILTIIADFTEDIWDFSLVMKQSENRI